MSFRTDYFRRMVAGFAFAAAVLAPALTATRLDAQAQGPYKVLDKWAIGGDGGWDYLTVDSPAHRLFLTRGARVDVVDTTTGKVTGSIPGLHGTHGVVFDATGKYGYVTDRGPQSTVVVFDRATLAVATTIPVGDGADAIVYEPVTKTVWAFSGKAKSATVIDTATLKAVATVALPGKPETPVADGKGLIYDNLEDKSSVVRIDAASHAITATWPAGCEGPTGLAFDAAAGHLFPTCDDKMPVIDVTTGKIVATAAIGGGPDAAGFSAKHGLAFASCGDDGVLAVVDAKTLKTIQSLSTEKRARTMAYDEASDRIYTVTADFGPAPTATTANPRPRPTIMPGSFRVIVIGR